MLRCLYCNNGILNIVCDNCGSVICDVCYAEFHIVDNYLIYGHLLECNLNNIEFETSDSDLDLD
jgi:hypothetical protein